MLQSSPKQKQHDWHQKFLWGSVKEEGWDRNACGTGGKGQGFPLSFYQQFWNHDSKHTPFKLYSRSFLHHPNSGGQISTQNEEIRLLHQYLWVAEGTVSYRAHKVCIFVSEDVCYDVPIHLLKKKKVKMVWWWQFQIVPPEKQGKLKPLCQSSKYW